MKLFDEFPFILYFWSDISHIFDINIKAGLIHFFPSHLLDGGTKEEEFEFIHHHDFGDLDHDFVKGDVVETGLFFCIFA